MPTKTTTRAFELTTFGVDKIVSASRTLAELGQRDVLVRMKAVSLNYRDFLVAAGLYSRNLKLPLVPLSDGAGEVVEVGSSVTRFKRGDRVAPIFMQRWIAGDITADAAKSALGGAIDGVLQDEAVFDESGLVMVPANLSYEEAATLPCAAVTAWNAMFEHGNVRPGDTVLTLGTGGVSVFALQFAKAAGANVVITSSSDEKLQRAKKLGADVLVNYKNEPAWDAAVLKTVPHGVDHVVELGGPGTLEKSVGSVKVGGHVSLIGVLAQGQFDPIKVLMKGVRLQGIFVGSREMFERMNKAIEHNKIQPMIDKKFKVEQISEAISELKNGSHFGKIVLTF